ncbi:DUF4062 domain-containing protein [uncultured Bacteroides sp.]|uniref:DUF4062 domain-containing protein n=1 Tax=uncultured Bacteroides sp. TaxID=162156 RepID=UPI002AAAF7FA|nr:DUF4062 domain-containing protein [uncultured Bacteroides sp.]
MGKKYQVFVSSTYEDLQEERQKVMDALLQMNCFPIGMERFNASDDDQWTVIQNLIKECDYYVLIIGGRYGSIEPNSGKSYTQKEFEYAIEQGVPIVSFVCKNPEELPNKKTEQKQEGKDKLIEFKKKVQTKLCKFWTSPDDLAAQVVLSLNGLIKTKPSVGWVRADELSSAEANKEILKLKKENDDLKKKIEGIQITPPIGSEKLQQGDDLMSLCFESEIEGPFNLKLTWNELFSYLAPFMMDEATEIQLRIGLRQLLFRTKKYVYTTLVEITNDDFYTVLIQFSSLGLIIKSDNKLRAVKDGNKYWTLTPLGMEEMVKLKALKR